MTGDSGYEMVGCGLLGLGGVHECPFFWGGFWFVMPSRS